MPELPEVETIVRYLRPKISGRKVLSMSSGTPRLFRDHKNFMEVKNAAVGKKIEGVDRTGKNIILKLSDGNCLVLHLMMTGKLLLNPMGTRIHDRLEILMSGNTRLVFNDTRKFGRCRIIKDSKTLGGVDALSLNFEIFKSLLSGRSAMIKNLLLNQKVISGIGNIYADEILWGAGIRPTRKINSLSRGGIKKLFSSLRHTLRLAIRKEGTSSRDYRKPDGTEGGYYRIRKAYQREGEKCSRDGAIIRRIKIGARSSRFCPKHQL